MTMAPMGDTRLDQRLHRLLDQAHLVAIVAASFTGYFLSDGCVYAFGFLYSAMLETFDEARGATAFVASLLYGLPMIFSPVSCALLMRFGSRPVCFTGGLLLFAGYASSAFISHLPMLYLTIGVLCSLGLSFTYVSIYLTIAKVFDKYLAIATGIAVAGSGMGTFAFAPLIDMLLKTYGWRGACLLLGAIYLHLLIVAFVSGYGQVIWRFQHRAKQVSACRTVPSVSETVLMLSTDEAQLADPPRNAGISRAQQFVIEYWRSIWPLRHNWPYGLFVLSSSIMCMFMTTPFLYLPDHMKRRALDGAQLLVAHLGLAMTIGQIGWGFMGDSLPSLAVAFFGLGIFGSGIALLALPLFCQYWLLLTVGLFYAVGMACNYCLQSRILLQLLPTAAHLSPAFGLMQMVQGVFVLAGVPVGGWIFDATGSYDVAFYVAGLSLCFAGVIMVLLYFCKHHTFRIQSNTPASTSTS